MLLKYLMMRFMAIQCGGSTFNMNWLTIFTANARPILVPTVACMKYLPISFAQFQILYLQVLTILNLHRMEFRPVCIFHVETLRISLM